MDSKVLARIDKIAAEAISEKATPGCQVLVARNGKVVFEKSYGYFTYDSVDAVNEETLYDIASITMVVETLQAILFR
jgi:CubicO group peptidase (beta-lactamase class C family)